MTLAQTVLIFAVLPILQILVFVVFVGVILSWLIAFNVVNSRNQFVAMIWRVTNGLTEPLLNPIRRILPNLGGIDLSPVVLLLAVFFLRGLIATQICPAVGPAAYCY